MATTVYKDIIPFFTKGFFFCSLYIIVILGTPSYVFVLVSFVLKIFSKCVVILGEHSHLWVRHYRGKGNPWIGRASQWNLVLGQYGSKLVFSQEEYQKLVNCTSFLDQREESSGFLSKG